MRDTSRESWVERGFARWRQIWWACPRSLRRGVAALVGGTLVGIGIIMVVTPGPAVIVIPIGLSILAAEFAWVRQRMRRWVPEAWQPEFLRRSGPEPRGAEEIG